MIDSAAKLADARDRDDLEHTLAAVMFELVEARSLVIWRAKADDAVGFEERVFFTLNSNLFPSPAQRAGGRPLSLNEMTAEARAACLNKRAVHSLLSDNAGRLVIPVMDRNAVAALVEIERAPPLDKDSERLISGLLRIYRSHLGIPDNSGADELTGLYNRQPFGETFRRMARIAAPENGLLSSAELAVVDIDFFQSVNECFGHVCGDEALVLLAGLMRAAFRECDRLFRVGGEEFVVMLPGLSPLDAERALERFRETVASHRFPEVGRITVSIGVTSILPCDRGPNAFGRAEEALYYAKAHGRNRLVRYETLVAAGEISRKDETINQVETS